mgnify:CR=1 FL=1
MGWVERYPWLIPVLIGVFCGLILIALFVGRRERRKTYLRLRRDAEAQSRAMNSLFDAIDDLASRLSSTTDELSRRQDRLRDSMDARLESLRRTNAETLSEVRDTVSTKLDARLNESFQTVNRQLADVHAGLGQMRAFAGEFADLKKVLGGVKTRGMWGEIQLGALLSEILSPDQYLENAAIPAGGQTRVEFAIRMPAADGELLLPVDSKFPQEDYARLTAAAEAGDGEACEAARRALMNAVRTEGKRIGKYIVPPYTTDFAVMFLPLEGLYAEVMRNAEVVETLQREQRILVAGPSTLLALLNSLQMGFRTLAIEQRSAEVWKLLGAVKTDFGNFAKVLEHTQEKLRQASDSIDSAFVRTRSIEKRLRSVEALEESEAGKYLPPDTQE